MLSIYDLTIEQKKEPLGLDEVQPRFSWKLKSDQNDTVQTAYRLTVSNSELLWDSGRVESRQSNLIEFLGETFSPRTAYTWEVTVWDNYGNEASASASFETGLLSASAFEGKAHWISHSLPESETASPIFIKGFSVEKEVSRARLYTTALGLYEAELNGKKLDDTFFTPGWTNYRKRLQVQTYAVEPIIGENELRFTLGKGWYCGKLGFDPQPNNYGDRTAMLAMLCIDYADGSCEVIGSDESWQVYTGAVRFSEIYDGETQDTTLAQEPQGAAVKYDYGFETLVGQENEPVRCLMRLDSVKTFTTPKGELVYDFGQNLTGWVELKIEGRRGQTLTLHHAESLDENGNFYTENLSFAKATDSYVLDGTAQTLRPHFTFHGFRYLWVEGLEEGQNAVFTACHLSTDLNNTGSFECSNRLVNRLQQNIQWSQRDNYLDVPTDCPQRSERLGWTGDATAYSPTAAFNANILPFMRKWLRDLSSEQTKEIGMPQVVPNIMGVGQAGAAYWGDVATVLPWTLYRVYGDRRILVEQFESMKLWVDYVTAQCGENGLWQTGFQYGDWLGLDAEVNALNEPRKGATEDYFAANACYLWSLQILADTASLLADREEENRYRALRERVLSAFREEYVTATGRLVCETQTAMVLALHLNLVEEKHRERIATMLKANIDAHKTHLVTGFIGTPYACLALSDNGMHELAGKLLLQEQNPSWLYEVKMGATTIWERWDSIMPDGRFNPANMNSLNHYAYGSIGNWLYTKLAGLEIIEPGYQRFSVRPQFIRGIEWVKLRYDSVYGPIRVEWSCQNKLVRVEVEIPANTTALVTLPEKGETVELGSGVYVYEYATETDLRLARYSMEMPLRLLMEHPVGMPMLRQFAPEMADNRMLEYVIDQPITALLAYAPQIKPLFEAIIAAMNAAEE